MNCFLLGFFFIITVKTEDLGPNIMQLFSLCLDFPPPLLGTILLAFRGIAFMFMLKINLGFGGLYSLYFWFKI